MQGTRVREKEKQGKVITLTGVRTAVITQRDLAEERLLNIEASATALALEEKRKWLRSRIREGWRLEPGLRSARLIKIAGGKFTVKRKPSEKLVVR